MGPSELYKQLNNLNERVLHFDTDITAWRVPWRFQNELNEGDTITEFASGGPKNYGYQTRQGKQECKVRGISLNSEGSKQLNFPILKQNAKDDILSPLDTGVHQTEVLKPHHIVRQAKKYAIVTEPQTKKYQMVYTKRVIDPTTFMTYPYGYQAAFNQQDMNNIDNLLTL